MRIHLANSVKYIHIGIFLFILTGWTCPSSKVLMTHAFMIPILILHWKTNNNTCFLTNLEHWLREGKIVPAEQEGRFVRGIVEKTCRVSPSDRALETYIYIVMISLMTVSFFRLGWL